MKDVLGEALIDYYHHGVAGRLWVNNKYGLREKMPVDTYFRSAEDMPELEWVALQQCGGRILDVGAGAGSHALAMQRMGLDVTALDISPKAAQVMGARGVEKVILEDFFLLGDDGGYDTLLFLMNGIGLAGTIDGLRRLLAQAGRLLRPGGRMIFDSSDIAYLYEGKIPAGTHYYGEILYQYEYKKQCGEWFKWLFIDRKTLAVIAAEEGWVTELLFEDEWGQYLVKCEMLR